MKTDFSQLPNINILWSTLIVEELYRFGLREFIVSPGSRNTPLIAALAACKDIKIIQAIDERAAAYFALGCAKGARLKDGSQRPAVVITTSGTAVINLLPAMAEASIDEIPLIILSADRPIELRDCGANQSIDQLSPLKSNCRWQIDLGTPDCNVSPRMLLGSIDYALRKATTDSPGPVHLNISFREPLTPEALPWDSGLLDAIADWQKSTAPLTVYHKPRPTNAGNIVDELSLKINKSKRGVLVVGKLSTIEDVEALVNFAKKLCWPLIADLTSGLSTHEGLQDLVTHAGLFIDSVNCDMRPDFVLQFGSRLTSQKVQSWLAESGAEWALIDESANRQDPVHGLHTHIQVAAKTIASTLNCESDQDKSWQEFWSKQNTAMAAILRSEIDDSDDMEEVWICRHTKENIEKNCLLFAGNSMPIRHLDDYSARNTTITPVLANRGASGIDGVLASACGAVCTFANAGVLVIGDISVLHDLNSLLLAASARPKLIIILINNHGGGIFNMLPISKFPHVLHPMCDTEHKLEFKTIAREFGLQACSVNSRSEFEAAYEKAQSAKSSFLIEAICKRDKHARLAYRINKEFQKVVGTI
jgi:2-succinyl-5-enolpyruvyl-6-hydroxy-3-cyclohexene-1-carboxylate synthase